MKLKRIKKGLCIISLALSLAIPTMAYAASYSTTFDFLVSVQGKARSFSGGKIWLDISSTETKNFSNSGFTTFSVTLYKKGFIFSNEIGSFKALRNGRTSNGWSNMEAGNYYFYLSKANDGASVEGSIKISQ